LTIFNKGGFKEQRLQDNWTDGQGDFYIPHFICWGITTLLHFRYKRTSISHVMISLNGPSTASS